MRRPAPLLSARRVTAIWGVTFVQVKKAVAVFPLFAFLAIRFGISAAVWRRSPGGRCGGSPARACSQARASVCCSPPPTRSRPRGSHRTTVSSTGSSRPLRRLHPDHRAPPLQDLGAVHGLGRGGFLASPVCCSSTARPEGRRWECARARKRPGAIRADRGDGALRAALRRARADLLADGGRRARGFTVWPSPSASSRRLAAGPCGARSSSPACLPERSAI